jgi:hypothetical protein
MSEQQSGIYRMIISKRWKTKQKLHGLVSLSWSFHYVSLFLRPWVSHLLPNLGCL